MDIQQLVGLFGFAFVSSVTPGPNNMMLMASGANFGIRRTIPHMLGVSVGFTLMIVIVGVGLLGLFAASPLAFTVLKVVSALYLLWLAWKIATTPPPAENKATSDGTPMSFIQAALFQWVNPKAWTMALTALTVYAGSQRLYSVLVVAAVFGAINLPTVGIWAYLGQFIQRWLTSDRSRHIFNWSMAAMLVGSLLLAI